MGVVYEAQDLTLGRRVALKFLPPDVARDSAALDRFLFEARAASALNHPNICTIYAVENSDGQSFIAMELLEGQSLDHKLLGPPLPLDRLLDISIQLTEALEAAHAKGIVHRDIKPANIFITQRSQIKVLDFGLAKLTREAEMAMDTVASQRGPAHLTSPGSTVGTVAYMSPEQARGEDLDARCDLFSLGAVMYQMATGRLPFSGATSAVIFSAILEHDPVPPLELNSELPPKLQEIIEKALEKDRDLRYQSAADLRGDLKRLKRDTESGKPKAVHVARAVASDAARPSSAISSSATAAAPAQSISATGIAASAITPPSSSSAVIAAARQHKLGLTLFIVLGMLLVLTAGYGVYAFLSRSRPAAFQNSAVTKVTETGNATEATISPDGKYILHVVNDNGLESLWLRNVPSNSNTQVVAPGQVHYIGLRFSPDGNYLYFVRSEIGSRSLKYLYRAPVLGGAPQKLVTDIDTNITFSPDGQKFAYVLDNNPSSGRYRLIIHSLETAEEKDLTSGSLAEGLIDPAWSPDGKVIVCPIQQPGDALSGLVAVDVAKGKRNLFFTSKTRFAGSPVWLPDSTGLLVLQATFNRAQVAFVSYPEGKLFPVTRDTNNYFNLSVGSDGHTFTTVLSQAHIDLYLIAAGATSTQASQLTFGAPVDNLSWAPDGQIILAEDGRLDLLNPDSKVKTPLLTQQISWAGSPSSCSNGRVAFSALPSGKNHLTLWSVDASGGNLKQMTAGKLDDSPECSSRGVLYQDAELQLMKVPVEGGASQKVSEYTVFSRIAASPDAKLAAFSSYRLGDPKEKLAVVSLDAGQTPKLLELEKPRESAFPDSRVRFSRDGKAVVYSVRTGNADNLWLQPLDGAPGHQITDFKSELIRDFDWSPDGRKIAILRGHIDSDVVLIRDSQQ